MDNYPKLMAVVSEITDTSVVSVVTELLLTDGFRECLGGMNHHPYPGGLVDHTLEVVNISRAIYESCGVSSTLSLNLILAGALLHDIGKAFMNAEKYKYLGVAHGVIGAYVVREMCVKHRVKTEVTDQLCNLVLEHLASAYRDKMKYTTRESYIVYLSDTLSASVTAHTSEFIKTGKSRHEGWEQMELATF